MATANSRASTVSLHLNRGNGTFRRRIAYGVAGYITAALWSVAIGDLNMDGRADLVAGNADDRSRAVSVFVNRGHGRFESKLDFGSDTAASWGMHAVGVADLNRDRKPDIALVVGYRTLAVLLNRPGLCSVQPVQEQLLSLARRTLARVNCGVNVRVGHSRFFSKYYPTQTRVIRQRPRAGSVLSARSKVNLLVSLGRKRHTRR